MFKEIQEDLITAAEDIIDHHGHAKPIALNDLEQVVLNFAVKETMRRVRAIYPQYKYKSADGLHMKKAVYYKTYDESLSAKAYESIQNLFNQQSERKQKGVKQVIPRKFKVELLCGLVISFIEHGKFFEHNHERLLKTKLDDPELALTHSYFQITKNYLDIFNFLNPILFHMDDYMLHKFCNLLLRPNVNLIQCKLDSISEFSHEIEIEASQRRSLIYQCTSRRC